MTEIIKFIQNWIYTNLGLIVTEQKIEFQLPNLLKSAELNEKSYIRALQAQQNTIVSQLITAFTVQESYFFRDASLFLYLKNTLLPQLIQEKEKNGDYQITIWSAGAAAGEEIYSIAIYLEQLLKEKTHWKINLIATDINEMALEKGRTGIFTKSSLRATDKKTIEEYFEVGEKNSYILQPKICKMVKFIYANIIHPLPSNVGKCDLIFCRNVFIYLHPKAIELALKNFYETLTEKGILFLGPSDFISFYQHNFSIEIIQNISLLRKKTKSEVVAPIIKPLATSPQEKTLTYSEQLKLRSQQLKQISLSLDKKEYNLVLEKIDNYLATYPETAIIYRYKAQALISLGDTITANIFLLKSIKLDPLDAISHFLSGLIALDANNNAEAINAFQKALYIKKNFPEAAYHLSLLYLQNKEFEKGMKWLKQALTFAKNEPHDKLILGGDATMGQLAEAIDNSISYYQGKKL